MPDRWGRVTGNDWNAMTGTINNISAMGQRNQQFKQNQEDRAEQKEYKDSVNYNVAALNEGQTQARPYEVDGKYVPPDQLKQETALTGSPLSQVAAREIAAKDAYSKQTIKSAKDAAEMRQKEDGILSWVAQNGIEAIDKIPTDLTSGVPGQKALESVLQRETSKAEYQQKLLQTRMPFLMEKYKIFSTQKEGINKALLEGREEDVVTGLQKMAKDLPISYQLGEFNPDDRTFDVQYFDRRTGKLQMTAKKPIAEVIQEMNKTGDKEYFTQGLKHMEAKRLENIKAEANYLRGKTRSGKAVRITPQVPVMEPDGNLTIRVKDANSGELLAEYKSWDALYDSGTSVEDLDRDKKIADINRVKAQTAASNASAKSAMGAGGSVNPKAQLDFLSKRISTTLASFKEGKGGIGISYDDTGQLVFDDDGSAYNKSQEFLYKHQNDYQQLSPQDQSKYKDALSINADMNAIRNLGRENQPQAMGGQPAPTQTDTPQPYTGNKPPIEGAKRGKDGKWYIQKNGGWEVVLDKKGGNGHVDTKTPQPGKNDTAPPPRTGDPAGEGEMVTQPEQSPQIRPELPQDMSQWNFQILPQNGQQVPVVITENGPIPLTPEEVEMYKAFSAQQKREALGAGIDWWKKNATGTQHMRSE